MGNLIKTHWARLVILTAAAYQILASLQAFFWPKILWDFSTPLFNPLVKPIPYLQTINLLLGIFIFAWEWPINLIAASVMHRSIEVRLVVLPFAILATGLMYQSTESAGFYLVGLAAYWVGFVEGERGVVEVPWGVGNRVVGGEKGKSVV